MKEILIIIIPIISTLVGVILGWGCTELSRHLTYSYQKKQTLNGTLSLLLELYFQIKRIQEILIFVQDLKEWYITIIEEKPINAEEKEKLSHILNGIITPMISSIASNDLQKLSSDYEDALKKLSHYYPVSAYRLRGRADISRILFDMNALVRQIEIQLPIEIGKYEELIQPTQTILQPKLIEDNLSSLKEDILDLSKDTGCQQRKEITKSLDNIGIQNPLTEQYMNLLKEQVSAALDNELSMKI